MEVTPHLLPTEWEVRLYPYEDVDKQYKEKRKWFGSMLIRRFGDTAWITMAQDNLDWKVVRSLRKQLLSLGMTKAVWDDGTRLRTLILKKGD